MFTDLNLLLESLEGQSYRQVRAFMGKKEIDYSAMINWWKLIPQRRRKAIKRRLYKFLFWQEGRFGSWKKFIKCWRKRSPGRRRKILLYWRNKRKYRHKAPALIIKIIRDRIITKKILPYLIRPLTKEQLQRVQLYWWAKLDTCCSHAKVLKTVGNDPCLEIKLSPHGPLLYF